jgi:hypothetical protein
MPCEAASVGVGPESNRPRPGPESAAIAPERAEQLRPVLAEPAGLSQAKLAAELNARGIPAPARGHWHAATVRRVQATLDRTPCASLPIRVQGG